MLNGKVDEQSNGDDKEPLSPSTNTTTQQQQQPESPEKSISRIFRRSSRFTNPTKDDEVQGPTSTQLVFIGAGGNEKMLIKERKLAEPVDTQVRVAIKFASINFIDLLKKQGVYPKTEQFPFVAGCEGAGIVDASGEGVNELKTGDRVIVFASNGCFSSSIITDQDSVVKIPKNVSLEDAAALYINYATAYDMLFNVASLKSGHFLLVPQIAGGVGHAIIQLAKTVPDVTIIGLCSESKHEYIRSLGVQHVIDYRKCSDYSVEVRKISPEGVDIIFDSLNGEDSVKAWNLLKPFGMVIHYGMASLSGPDRSPFRMFKGWFRCLSLNSLKIINSNRKMAGYHLGALAAESPSHMKNTLNKLLTMVEQGTIKPCLDSIFPLSEGRKAFDRLQNRENVGKILLSTDSTDITIFPNLPLATASTAEHTNPKGDLQLQEQDNQDQP